MQHAANVTSGDVRDWHAIDWKRVYRTVKNLRQRIFRASRDGDLRRVRSLQRLMLRCTANVLESVRRVTQVNQGKRTAGVDHVVTTTPEERGALCRKLQQLELHKVHPVRRVYIPKKKGKRPLGIPTIEDRCVQAMVKNALEPFWEARFEGISYGFRPGRGCHDAIEKVFRVARPNTTRPWVLDADIEGAFDNIGHAALVKADGEIDRHYYELCTLWELRGALRAGNIWVPGSRRYANPDTYLIPKAKWPSLRPAICQELRIPENGAARLEERGRELHELLPQVNRLMAGHRSVGEVRMEKGRVVVPPLEAEEQPASVKRLDEAVTSRLPLIDLPDLLIEVDQWTDFAKALRHLSGQEPRRSDLLPTLYAALLSQGCNFGFARMAQMADISADRLAWCTAWHLREETLEEATTTLVNFHHGLPLAQHWGGGTLSSSDGQRIPVAGKIRNATALPRYFRHQGLTYYTWTSDQLSQYGTKVIPATVRDATYVLDAILDNETELTIVEHATDTAGYTDVVFALFDLLGMQFAPRLRDLGDQQLYRMSREQNAGRLAPRFKGTMKQDFIVRHWDDMLRLAGSLKRGWVTASLFISKLQAYPRQNVLTRALQESGRLVKTLFILRYLQSADYRRRIHTQLNKGESLHALRDFLFVGDKGVIRRKQYEAQTNQAMCLNVVTNAVIIWNTVYMQAALDQLRAEGYLVQEEDLAHLSPARFAHINPYGKYFFPIEQARNRQGLRSLRAA